VKILTVLGTRPEIIRLSRVIERLDAVCDSHVLVHTGQNFDPGLSDVFFSELGIRQPDVRLGVRASGFGDEVAQILARTDEVFERERPDRILVLGDTNSGLSAFMAKRKGIRVYHMEAGNRCFDDRVPEEVNRRVIDHSSDVLLPYTERSRSNLLREGIPSPRILVTGNPIYEVLCHYAKEIDASRVLERLGLETNGYFLATMHRQENVDDEARLRSMIDALTRVAREYGLPVVCSTHPRTRTKLDALRVAASEDHLRLEPPFGFFDFVALERAARLVLTDSGTVQEECSIFGVPAVTLRDTTERPETIECGSNVLSGVGPDDVLRCVGASLELAGTWSPPDGYLVENVSQPVIKILMER
jgi:UDP-N-acetylglucosamine 2-epimerase (non-hydrolysing)